MEKEEIEHISRLARIELNEEEKDEFSQQISSVLEYFGILDEVDTEVPPTYHVLGISNVFKEDTPKESLAQEVILKNAPKKEKGYFKGPRIV
jgi:aspartyl-tRNA(Asn)/glutamyl-tRNA(Gln) amidotransferase subunit C